MSKQAHDAKVKKSKTNKKPMPLDRLRWLRMKRKHPGPIPAEFRSYSEWVKAGRPKLRRRHQT